MVHVNISSDTHLAVVSSSWAVALSEGDGLGPDVGKVVPHLKNLNYLDTIKKKIKSNPKINVSATYKTRSIYTLW